MHVLAKNTHTCVIGATSHGLWKKYRRHCMKDLSICTRTVMVLTYFMQVQNWTLALVVHPENTWW